MTYPGPSVAKLRLTKTQEYLLRERAGQFIAPGMYRPTKTTYARLYVLGLLDQDGNVRSDGHAWLAWRDRFDEKEG